MRILFDLETIVRLFNSFFTMGIGLLLAYMYLGKKARIISILAWSIAFMLYGLEILVRVWYPWGIETLIIGIPMGLLLVLGTSNLLRKNRIYSVVSLVALVVIVYLALASVSDAWYRSGGFAFFGIMTIAVVHLRMVIGKLANRFIAGWLTLLIANVFFVAIFSLEWAADLAAIPAKALIALGMFDQRFAKMILDIKEIYEAYSKTQVKRHIV